MGKSTSENGFDRALRAWFSAHMGALVIGILVAVSIAIRILIAPETTLSPDYMTYCKEWVEYYRIHGIAKGLSVTIGDYYTPLNLMYAFCSLLPVEPWIPLAVISCFFEYLGAYFLYRLLVCIPSGVKADAAALIAVITLFLPHSIFNSALWKQCDSVYTCFVILSLLRAVQEKYGSSFFWFAVSFAVKFQAVFFAPFFLLLYFARKGTKIWHFFWIPAVYFVAGLPAVLCRHGLRATYLTYFAQAQEGTTEGYGLTAYFPNIYQFGLDDYYDLLILPAVLLAGAAVLAVLYAIYRQRESLDARRLLGAAIALCFTCVVFMPSMHERYDYALVLILTAYVLAFRRRLWWIAASLNLVTMLTHGIVLFYVEELKPLLYPAAVLYIACFGCFLYDFLKEQPEGNSDR